LLEGEKRNGVNSQHNIGVYRIPITEDEDNNDTAGIFEGIGGGSASKVSVNERENFYISY